MLEVKMHTKVLSFSKYLSIIPHVPYISIYAEEAHELNLKIHCLIGDKLTPAFARVYIYFRMQNQINQLQRLKYTRT